MNIFYRLFFLLLLSSSTFAANSFLIKSINISGLVNISKNTVYSHSGLKIGKVLEDDDLKKIIVKLYKSKFFKSVSLNKLSNGVLQVTVVERPMVSFVGYSGQKALKKELIDEVLVKNKVQAGQPYSPSLINQVTETLTMYGHEQGVYNVKINADIEKLTNNRVRVLFKINEGEKAKVKQINFFGNSALTAKQISSAMSLEPHWWSFISDNNSYSVLRLQQDLAAIKDKYLDYGYINAKVTKKSVKFNDDDVVLNINIEEGEQFKIGKILVQNVKYKDQILKMITTLKVGDIFSRKELIKVIENIAELFKDKGYAYVEVDPSIRVDNSKKLMSINFKIKPGPLVIIRHVSFFGNTSTNDRVLRREMLQNEAELYSSSHVKNSIRKINNLGYVRNAKCDLVKVPGHVDQADLSCFVTELPSISAGVSVGYGSQNGALFQLNFAHKSLLGTGYGFKFNATRMITAQSVSASLFNPYFTDSGISQNISFNLENFSPARTNNSTWRNRDFAFENRGIRLGVDYGIPITSLSHFNLGFYARTTDIRLGDDPHASFEEFINEFGHKFKELTVKIGLSRNSLDRIIFPTEGSDFSSNIELGLPIADFLRYYKLDVKSNYYQPLGDSAWIFKARGGLGYGRGYGSRGNNLPFFKNYFAGGMDTVRGFAPNSLGEKDSKNRSIGGSMLAYASAALIFPEWFGEDIRLAMFVDAGGLGSKSIGSDDLRYSSGIEIHWRTAIAPLVFSFATPLKKHHGDIQEVFAFELGTVF